MKKVIRLTENNLVNIVKNVLNENITLQEKLLKTIDRIGLFKTLKSIGYNGFDKVLPDYFTNNENKVKLINDVTKHIDGNILYIYELLGHDLIISTEKGDGGEYVEHLTYIDGDYGLVSVYFYDEDDEMSDSPTNEYDIKLIDLPQPELNLIFEKIVDYIPEI